MYSIPVQIDRKGLLFLLFFKYELPGLSRTNINAKPALSAQTTTHSVLGYISDPAIWMASFLFLQSFLNYFILHKPKYVNGTNFSPGW